MWPSDPDRAREAARRLVEALTAYEEELLALECDTPAVEPLRRAVGAAIAEACYWITERPQRSFRPADGVE